MTTLQSTAPIERLTLKNYTRAAWHFTKGDYLLDPEYQRGSVWTDNQRRSLIYSFMAGIPVPGVVVNDRFEGFATGDDDGIEYAVVDGKQRIEAVSAWFGSQLAVPASWFGAGEVHVTEDTEDGPYVRYNGLTDKGAFRTEQWPLPEHVAQVDSVGAEARLFLLLNGGGVTQTSDDMDRAQAVASDGGTR